MKPSHCKVDFEFGFQEPSCANLALKPQPYLEINEVSQILHLDFTDQKEGVSEDAFDIGTIKEDLFNALMDHFVGIRPEYAHLVPKKSDMDKFELRLIFHREYVLCALQPREGRWIA
jgi:hypothetical protein